MSKAVFIFPFQSRISGSVESDLRKALEQVLVGWNTHGAVLSATLSFPEQHFLLVTCDESQDSISGCAKDDLRRAVDKELEKRGVLPASIADVFFRGLDGNIHRCSRAQFRSKAKSGEISGSTEVFDISVQDILSFQNHFCTKCEESWHWKLVESDLS